MTLFCAGRQSQQKYACVRILKLCRLPSIANNIIEGGEWTTINNNIGEEDQALSDLNCHFRCDSSSWRNEGINQISLSRSTQQFRRWSSAHIHILSEIDGRVSMSSGTSCDVEIWFSNPCDVHCSKKQTRPKNYPTPIICFITIIRKSKHNN